MDVILKPAAPVRVIDRTDPFNPGRASIREERWQIGCTVGHFAHPEAGAYVAVLNGQVVPDEHPVEPGDHICFRWIPEGLGVGEFFAYVLASIVASAITTYIAYQLIGELQEQIEQDDTASQTYSWQGVRVSYRGRGLVIPELFNSMEVGGVVIQSSVRVIQSNGSPRSILYLLIALGSGPFQEIAGFTSDQDFLSGDDLSGIRLNGNPASNYPGVIGFVRMGSLSQQPIDGFSAIEKPEIVDLAIDNATGATDWSTAATYSLQNEAQAFLITLVFPQGLYVASGTGAFTKKSVEVDIRWRPLDGAGSPTGPYVEHPGNPHLIEAELLGSFQHQIPGTFLPSGLVVPPSSGQAVRLGSQTSHLRSFQTNLKTGDGGFYAGGSRPAEWSVQAWALMENFFIPDARSYVGWYTGSPTSTDPTAKGFFLKFLVNTSGTSPRVLATIADGTAQQLNIGVNSPLQSVQLNEWTHGVLTFKRDGFSPGVHRVRLYVNGTLAEELQTSVEIEIPDQAGSRFRVGPTESLVFSNWDPRAYDEIALWDREITPAEVQSIWSFGNGSQVSAASPGLLAVYRFEGNINDSGANGNPIVNDGPDAPTFESGPVPAPGEESVGVISRWELQVQRRNIPSDLTTEKDEVRWLNVIGLVFDEIAYRGWALLGLHIDASDQLSNGQPNVTTDCVGPLALAYDPETESWFDTPSGNPAWQAARYATSSRLLGQQYDTSRIDAERWWEWAQWCDELVPDQLGAPSVDSFQVGLVEGQSVLELRFIAQPPSHWIEDVVLRYSLTSLTGATAGQNTVLSTINGADLPIYGTVVEEGTGAWLVRVRWPQDVIDFNLPAVQSFGTYAAGANLVTVPTEGYEPRHQCDLYIDGRGVRAWTGLLQIMRTGRAVPVRDGATLSLRYEAPGQPVHLYNRDKIEAGSFSLSVAEGSRGFNRARGEILDRRNGYQRLPVVESSTRIKSGDPTVTIRERNVDLRGITRESHARRELQFLITAGELLRLNVQFDVQLEALSSWLGEVIFVEHSLPNFHDGSGGLVETASANNTSLLLDKEVVLQGGVTYMVAVQSIANGKLATATVTSPAGTYPVGSPIAVDGLEYVAKAGAVPEPITPQVDDAWALGPLEGGSRRFRIQRLTFNPQSHVVTVRALEYLDEAYVDPVFPPAFDEFSASSAVLTPPVLGDEPAIRSFSAHEGSVYSTLEQKVVPQVVLEWEHDPGGPPASSVEFWAQGEDQAAPVLIAQSAPLARQLVARLPFRPGGLVRFLARPVGLQGARTALSVARGVSIRWTGQVPAQGAPPPLTVRRGARGTSYILIDSGAYRSSELRRGARWFLADRMHTFADGASSDQESDGWVFVPPNLAGEGNPNLSVRRQVGDRGWSLPSSLASPDTRPAGRALVHSYEAEDAGWTVGTALLNLVPATVGSRQVLDLDPGLPLGTQSAIFTAPVQDIGSVATRHVSIFVEAEQVHPVQLADLDPLERSFRRDGHWTTEGPLDPADPLWRTSRKLLEVRYSDTDDPTGAAWEAYSPGRLRFRSIQFRVSFSSGLPVGDQNMSLRVHRAALALHIPETEDVGVTYNGSGQVSSVSCGTAETTFTYNADGTVDTITKGDVTRQLIYDGAGNLTGVVAI